MPHTVIAKKRGNIEFKIHNTIMLVSKITFLEFLPEVIRVPHLCAHKEDSHS